MSWPLEPTAPDVAPSVAKPETVTCAHAMCSYDALGTAREAAGHLEIDLWPGPIAADPDAETDPEMLCRHHLIDAAERHMRVSSGHQAVA